MNTQTIVNSEKVDRSNENDMRENIIIPDFENIGSVGPAKHKMNLVSPKCTVELILRCALNRGVHLIEVCT